MLDDLRNTPLGRSLPGHPAPNGPRLHAYAVREFLLGPVPKRMADSTECRILFGGSHGGQYVRFFSRRQYARLASIAG